MSELLFEIGLEEIPARMIAAAEAELARRVSELLTRERLGGEAVKTYSTPRRLAVHLTGVLIAQPDAEEQLTGPSWAIAFKDGAPTGAAQAFAKKAGVAVDALQKVTTPKGEYVGATVQRPGRATSEVVAELLPKELAAIYWPKNMYWRAGKPERFVRPVKWLLALLDHAILPVEFAGVHAANLTYGHRILHGPSPVTINHPSDYVAALAGAKVMADVAARRHIIRKALDHATRTVTNARWREDEELVETVTHLTEWPSVVLGTFEPEYLSLPEEVLVTVMRDHQKYFAVEDKTGKLAPHFLAVLNTEADETGLAVIRHGNARVLRARFNDARFFWNFDQKISLEDRVDLLKSVTFQKDLGTYYEKTERVQAVAAELAALVQARGAVVDAPALRDATRLAKVDLTTELVKEFTELQGVVGGLYAKHQRLSDKAGEAIYSQYQPASITDPIPSTIEGQLLGIADRITTIADMFAIGLIPTSSKDPYGLRRAANAVVKILAEGKLPITLAELESIASTGKLADTVASVHGFLLERVEFYMREVYGLSFDVVNAVLAVGVENIPDAIARTQSLASVRGLDDFAAISAAFKRSKNILRQAADKKLIEQGTALVVDQALLTDTAEQELYAAAQRLIPAIEALRAKQHYMQALEQIAKLRPHVDLFFEKVMVMAENPQVRQNRLALLTLIVAEFSKIADFSEMGGAA